MIMPLLHVESNSLASNVIIKRKNRCYREGCMVELMLVACLLSHAQQDVDEDAWREVISQINLHLA